MKSRSLKAFTVAALVTAAVATARAEDPTNDSGKLEFTGFADISIAYNSNSPDNHESFVSGTGTTAKSADEVSLNLAAVQIARTGGNAGFTLSLVAGDGADVVHAGEPKDTFRNVYQASGWYKAPIGNGLVLEGGIYPSHIGFEAFFSKDNWNYTRSWLGEFSPFYQAGVKASYPFTDHWSAQLHVLNGWQIIDDNNEGKAVGTQIAYSGDKLSASFNTFFGPELAGNDDSMRKFGDLVVVYKASPALSLGTSVDVGAQERPELSTAKWNGVAVYARYAPAGKHAFAIRAERFHDPDNGITGTPQTLREATLTWEYRANPHAILKLETRYDDSTADVFGKDNQTTDNEFLAIVGAVFTF